MYGRKRKNVLDSPLPNKKKMFRGRVARSILVPCGRRSRNGREMCLRKDLCCQEDIMEEILLRLPLKPLHRCMSLSKNSRSSISSKSFARKYRKSRMPDDAHSNLLMGFFRQLVDFGFGHAEIDFFPLSTQGTRFMGEGFDGSLTYLEPATVTSSDALGNTRFSLVASSNSFLLCKKEEFAPDKSETLLRRDYYVCNPLTKQRKLLPKPPDTILKCELGTFICCGDGYPCLDWMTYTVVLGSDDRKSHLHVEIFSSQTGEWVAMHLSATIHYLLDPPDVNPPVMSESGTVCVVAESDDSADICCMVFNSKQKTNQLQTVNRPRPGFEVAFAMLFQCLGRIYMASRWSEVIELWELNEDKWIWDLKYRVDAVEIFSRGFENEPPRFLGLDPSNPAVALMELDGINALVNLEKKTYVLTSPYPDIHLMFLWHPYQWPPCAISDQ